MIMPTTDMTASPLDRDPAAAPQPTSLVQLGYRPPVRWVPSRFNARTVGDDGRLILWNTFSGAINLFEPKDRERVLEHLSAAGVAEPLDRVGAYLDKRGYLVRSDIDELDRFRYRYAREQWRSDVLQFILLASEDCNFRCVYCYEKFKQGTMRPEVRDGVKNLTRARLPHLSTLTISWFGGEPLYGWEAVEDLSPFFRRTADEHGLRHTQHMTTNGYLLTEERATKLLEWGCTDYQITLDGLPEDHDCKRVGRDGSPTHAVILDNLRSLKARRDAKFSVAVRVNFDNRNFPRLGPFLEALSEDFAGDSRFQMRFRAVGQWGGDLDAELDTCGVEKKRSVERQLRQKADELQLHQEGGIEDSAKLGSGVCYAARPYNFIVGATGKLMKCTIALDELEENLVGQLHPDGRLELNEERMAKWVKPYFESDPLCQKCYILPTCQGVVCPLPRIREGRRACCRMKSNLKFEMRVSLDKAMKTRAAKAAAAAV
jgi:uncharacterized protein